MAPVEDGQLPLSYDLTSDAIIGMRIAVLGYGAQGQSHALNLRDSGAEVIVGLPSTATRYLAACDAGFTVLSPKAAVQDARLVAMLVPDEVMAEVYTAIEPALRAPCGLVFAHGFALHYGAVRPRADLDAILVAPKGQGKAVREAYLRGSGVPGLLAVHQDVSGHAKELAAAYAAALGCGRCGVLEVTVAEETEADLVSEQAVLCGGITQLVKTGFEVLVEAGFPPEVAYFECLHELKLVVDLLHSGGLVGMHQGISNTAEFGALQSGALFQQLPLRAAMHEILASVRSGDFSKRWLTEASTGMPMLQLARQQTANHPIEVVGARLRSRMQQA
ncbi:MAG: ketol-acid reductoisomerase [Cyanobacteria bacterium NC_groundwater_1444_Ag_S-0.65um_54_12]|nr:ketol-acid reductoisomerase [Cyanobacteria bacterium NC_groundwater_1444_Ag_S-0.65um_54_12]